MSARRQNTSYLIYTQFVFRTDSMCNGRNVVTAQCFLSFVTYFHKSSNKKQGYCKLPASAESHFEETSMRSATLINMDLRLSFMLR
jgi:hypothetical protein